MIQKLLDETYWTGMERDMSSYLSITNSSGIYFNQGKIQDRLTFLVHEMISQKMRLLEEEYFGAQAAEPYPVLRNLSNFVKLPELLTLTECNLDHMKREIGAFSTLIPTIANYVSRSSTPYKRGEEITLSGQGGVLGEFLSDKINRIKESSDLSEMFHLLEEMVIYKIKESKPYKEMQL